MKIDEPEGEALAEAVALAQEWTRYSDDAWLKAEPGVVYEHDPVYNYRPDLNADQALELRSKLENDWITTTVTNRRGTTMYLDALDNERTSVMASGATMEVAICRAFLKANDLMRRCISFRRPV